MKNIFKNWKPRASSISHILTCLPKELTSDEKKSIQENIDSLLKEKNDGINSNGRKVKWTETKEKDLEKLNNTLKGEDKLPSSAITHLEDIFRVIFYKRIRVLTNKYLDKGKICEQDAIALISETDGVFYVKNKERFYNQYSEGEPDILKNGIVQDTKCNYDLKSFDEAELISDYEYQLKDYCWLTGAKKGLLRYCLVNNPLTQILQAKKSYLYSIASNFNWHDVVYHTEKNVCEILLELGYEKDGEEIRDIQQIERNMIFDIEAFIKENPTYIFENEELDFSIPAKRRVKTFEVTLTEQDKKNIIRRVKMCRKFLIEKEKNELKLLKV